MTPARLRAARPRLTTRITSRVSSMSRWSTREGSLCGHWVRCTLSGAVLSAEVTRFWYTSSATKGVNGASSLHSVTRQAYRVWYAASLSASFSDFQKRRRLRRTYQLERSSTNAWMARPALVGSYSSRCSVTRRTRACSSDSTQRSSSERSPCSARAGSKRSMLA